MTYRCELGHLDRYTSQEGGGHLKRQNRGLWGTFIKSKVGKYTDCQQCLIGKYTDCEQCLVMKG